MNDLLEAQAYRRTLAYILSMAVNKLFPENYLEIQHSLGNSYYYLLKKSNSPDTKAIKDEMKRLIDENLPISVAYYSYEEALEMLKDERFRPSRLLVEEKNRQFIDFALCGTFYAVYDETLLPTTGLIEDFDIIPFKEGFLLCFPRIGETKIVKKEKNFSDSAFQSSGYNALCEIYRLNKQWNLQTGIEYAGELNQTINSGGIKEYIRMEESFQQRNLNKIADEIAARHKTQGLKAVLIAGPSSSGKTTTAKRLSIELKVLGLLPQPISLDNYYVNTDKTPLDEAGNPDYECLEALDIAFLNEQLQALLQGKEVRLCSYDFKTGRRRPEGAETIRMSERSILIIEGIHGLNDKLTPSIAKKSKFKLYVSALYALNLDNLNRIPASDGRIIRRMVRDSQFRKTSAEKTLSMWPSVQAGERKHIFPFQNAADAFFNSSLDYEVSALRFFAEPLLRSVKPTSPEYAETKRLLHFIENFTPIAPEMVPAASILREFIGGSEFKY
ncbi:MAG: nucleoside kinase [Spirochaetaceae bacterium]|jgi:uridine kinase|nr:nucleoside kinase [Spirochaetaceae bacterium]